MKSRAIIAIGLLVCIHLPSLASGSTQAGLATLPEPPERFRLPEGRSSTVKLSRDASSLLLWSPDFAELIDAGSGELIRRFDGRNNVKFSPTGEFLTLSPVTSKQHPIEVYRAGEYETPWRVYYPKESLSWSTHVFSPDGRFLAILTSRGGKIHACTVVDLESGEQRVVARGQTYKLTGHMALSPGGSVLALAATTGDIWLWSVSEDKAIRKLSAQTLIDPLELAIPYRTIVYDMEFSPDGRYLAASELSGRVQRWEADTGQRITSLAFPPGHSALTFSQEGLLAVVTTVNLMPDTALLTLWEFTAVGPSRMRAPKPGTVGVYENINYYFRAAGHYISGVAFSGDARHLAITEMVGDGPDKHRSVAIYSIEDLMEWAKKYSK